MTDVEKTEPGILEEEQMRANIYGLLGTLLLNPPTERTISVLRDIEIGEEMQANAMAATWKSLNLAARRCSPDELNDEYHDLFIGVGRGEVVPYGSWYLTGFLMDRPLARLRRDLENLGIERMESIKEPEDHAGALCESMSLIIGSGGDIAPNVQKHFFDDNIDSWMVKFFEDLQGAPSADFYKAVGALGEHFLGIERQYLEMMAG